MKASALGLANLKRIVPNLVEWTSEDTKDYSQLNELYNNVYGQYRRYIGHVTANIGGVYEYYKTSDEGLPIYNHVEKQKQKDAIRFLNENLFNTPTWLIDKNILGRIEETGIVERIRGLQDRTIAQLLNPDRLHRMMENTAINQNNAYNVNDMMTDLVKNIYSEAKSGQTPSIYRRNLQRTFIEGLERVLGSESNIYEHSDAKAIARGTLKKIKQALRSASGGEELTKYHYADLADRITEVFEVGVMKAALPTGISDEEVLMKGCFQE